MAESPTTATRPLRQRLPHDWRSQTLIGVVLVLGAAVMLLPFWWMFATSLSRKADISMPRTPSLWPPN